jgi:hypothetical protein
VEASANIRDGMGDIRKGIREGMAVVGLCMVVSTSGVCLVAVSLLGRSK